MKKIPICKNQSNESSSLYLWMLNLINVQGSDLRFRVRPSVVTLSIRKEDVSLAFNSRLERRRLEKLAYLFGLLTDVCLCTKSQNRLRIRFEERRCQPRQTQGPVLMLRTPIDFLLVHCICSIHRLGTPFLTSLQESTISDSFQSEKKANPKQYGK